MNKFDFLRERTNHQNSENSDKQQPEISNHQQPKILRTQNFNNSELQTSENTKVQQPESSKIPGRPKGKRSDPNFTQVTSYVKKETYKQVKRELLDDEREFSELIQELLEEWLEAQS